MSPRHAIVGTGPAAIAAAETILAKEPRADLTLYGDDPYGFYSRPGLAYFLTGEVSERQLALRQGAGLKHVRTRIVAVNPTQHRLEAEDGRAYPFDRLLLATGSLASRLDIPGSGLEGVVKLDDLADAKKILRLAHRCQSAVVVGGGITALELVEALVLRKVETHFLFRSDRYWPNVLDEVESRLVEGRLADHRVHLHRRSQIALIAGRNGKVESVETGDGQRIKCQLVAAAVGVQPRIDLAASAGIRTDRGILVDGCLNTGVDGIFAAGDVAQVFDPFSGKAVLDTLWGKALAQGRTAGANMTGETISYGKAVPFNVTRLAGLTTTIVGTVGQGKEEDIKTIARGDSETWRQVSNVMAVQWDHEVNRTRLMVGQRNLVGAVVMGDQTLSRPLLDLIGRRADITPISSALSRADTSLADSIIGFWELWCRRDARA